MYPNAETQPGMLMLRVDGECRRLAARMVAAPAAAGRCIALTTHSTLPHPSSESNHMPCCPWPPPLLPCAAAIWFANVQGVADFIREKVAISKKRREEMGDHMRFVIIDLSPVTDIDSSAMHFLGGWVGGGWVDAWVDAWAGECLCVCGKRRQASVQMTTLLSLLSTAKPLTTLTHPPPLLLCLLPCLLPADDFIDELAADGIELVLANPPQQVRAGGRLD
jgi:hypothetical protein